jgi:hypothetical protein
MDAEFAALQGHGTWNLVELPRGRKAIACRWVYAHALKQDEMGTIVRHKARLVAKGYSQQAGTDSTAVRAPVMGCTDGICRAFVLVPATYSTALHSQGIDIVADVKLELDGLLEQSRATDLAACFFLFSLFIYFFDSLNCWSAVLWMVISSSTTMVPGVSLNGFNEKLAKYSQGCK